MVEQLAVNQPVAGSIPALPAKGAKVEIKNFAPDDPIPDLFGNYKPGHVITRPDGRKFKRGLFGQWERVTDEDTLDGRTGGA